MLKNISKIFGFVSIIILSSVSVFAQEVNLEDIIQEDVDIAVYYNDVQIVFADQKPVMQNYRVLVPFRAVLEAMQVQVTWNQDEMTVEASRNFTDVSLTIDSNKMIRNGEEKELVISPIMLNNRVMVPLRAIVEAFAADVEWDQETQTVYIYDDEISTGDWLKITEDKYSQTEMENGQVLADVLACAPKLWSDGVNSESIKKINQYYENIADSFVEGTEDFQGEYNFFSGDIIKIAKIDVPTEAYTAYINYEVTYNANNIVSIKLIYTTTLGNEVYQKEQYDTFDVVTGEKVEYSDVLMLSADKVQKILSVVEEKLQSSQVYFEGAKFCVAVENESNSNEFLTLSFDLSDNTLFNEKYKNLTDVENLPAIEEAVEKAKNYVEATYFIKKEALEVELIDKVTIKGYYYYVFNISYGNGTRNMKIAVAKTISKIIEMEENI